MVVISVVKLVLFRSRVVGVVVAFVVLVISARLLVELG